MQARSKLPKKRRRVLPVEQPRRKKVEAGTNRRMNAIKHHHPPVFKDAFGGAKLGKIINAIIVPFVEISLIYSPIYTAKILTYIINRLKFKNL